jgi:hypothetical protein
MSELTKETVTNVSKRGLNRLFSNEYIVHEFGFLIKFLLLLL